MCTINDMTFRAPPCMYTWTSRSSFRRLAETLFRGRGAMVPLGKEELICARASVNKLGSAA